MLIIADPEVQTLTSLTNVQNSLFIPNLGRFVNRRPTYNLQRAQSENNSLEEINRILAPALEAQAAGGPQRLQRTETQGTTATMATLATIDSTLSDSRYAVLPHGTSLEGWSKEDKKEMNDHVRHMLHSKRSKFKRSMKGFGQYVRRRKFVTFYKTLDTNTRISFGLLGYIIRRPHHTLWSCVGTFPNWLDQRRRSPTLYYQRSR